MATAYVDTVDALEYEEDEDGPTLLVRSALVSGLTDGDVGLFETALATSGIPAVDSSPSDYPELNLVNRKCQMVPGNKGIVRVLLTYRRRSKTVGNFVFSGGASLTQTTQSEDRFRNPITVAHTFLATDVDFPSQSQTRRLTMAALKPTPTMRAVGTITTDVPLVIRNEWIGYVNSEIWCGDTARMWLVTAVDFEEIDTNASPAKWNFTFEFQRNNDEWGWDLRAAFIDERHVWMPSNPVIVGVGIKRIEFYPERDFNTLFPQ